MYSLSLKVLDFLKLRENEKNLNRPCFVVASKRQNMASSVFFLFFLFLFFPFDFTEESDKMAKRAEEETNWDREMKKGRGSPEEFF